MTACASARKRGRASGSAETGQAGSLQHAKKRRLFVKRDAFFMPRRQKSMNVFAAPDAIDDGADHDDEINEDAAHAHETLRGGVHGAGDEFSHTVLLEKSGRPFRRDAGINIHHLPTRVKSQGGTPEPLDAPPPSCGLKGRAAAAFFRSAPRSFPKAEGTPFPRKDERLLRPRLGAASFCLSAPALL